MLGPYCRYDTLNFWSIESVRQRQLSAVTVHESKDSSLGVPDGWGILPLGEGIGVNGEMAWMEAKMAFAAKRICPCEARPSGVILWLINRLFVSTYEDSVLAGHVVRPFCNSPRGRQPKR